MRRWSASLIAREMPIGTTTRHCPTGWPPSKQKTAGAGDDVPRARCGRTTARPPWKTAWRPLTKLNIELACDPATPLLGTHRKRAESRESKSHLCAHVHSNTIHNTGSEARTSTDGVTDTQKAVHTYDGILFGLFKRKGILTPATAWMNLQDTVLSDTNHLQKDKECMRRFDSQRQKVHGGHGRGEGGDLMARSFSWENEKVLEVCCAPM